MSEDKNKNASLNEALEKEETLVFEVNKDNEDYSLNDDRRVKVLSPGQLVAKRFFRNRLAVTGMAILIFMFVFSFIGGILSPYAEDQKFYRMDTQVKDYAAIMHNEDYRYSVADATLFNSAVQAQSFLAVSQGEDSFSYRGVNYDVEVVTEGQFFIVRSQGNIVGLGCKELVTPSLGGTMSFQFTLDALMAKAAGQSEFTTDGKTYTMDEDGVIFDGDTEIAYVSEYIVKAIMGDVVFSRDFKNELIDAAESGAKSFEFTDEDGNEAEYILKYDAAAKLWDVQQETATRIFDTYSAPSKEHWLGTDRNGMDMLTRLMYGGRISLMIGFIVVLIESFLGVVMGGIAGYFGGLVDAFIMRLVDIFFCIPSMPFIIIVGAAMDAANVPSLTRMIYLMLILGFLGWAGVARLVRGQILSLREQEFMTATEATGIAPSRRIFKHLIPNVMPQLIVVMTMGLGGTIITEATLSFLGLGVRFPFASWGNIINDVNDTFVLTNYWFIWIPAGVLLLLTVLAFNIVGDGLRDAFDPKMKR
jgi:peptide/nickel transport system permease protein